MLKGYLRLVVMNTLSDRKLSGYDLKKQIEKEIGWKPSYGSIYPLLEKLLAERLVGYNSVGRSKVYYLTLLGKKYLPEMNKGRNMLADNMISALNAFGKIIEEREKNFMMEVFSSIKIGKLPFSELNPEIGEFRGTLYETYSKSKNRKKIKSILKKTTKELKGL